MSSASIALLLFFAFYADALADVPLFCKTRIKCEFGTATCLESSKKHVGRCGLAANKKAIQCQSGSSSIYICCAEDGSSLVLYSDKRLNLCSGIGNPLFEQKGLNRQKKRRER